MPRPIISTTKRRGYDLLEFEFDRALYSQMEARAQKDGITVQQLLGTVLRGVAVEVMQKDPNVQRDVSTLALLQATVKANPGLRDGMAPEIRRLKKAVWPLEVPRQQAVAAQR